MAVVFFYCGISKYTDIMLKFCRFEFVREMAGFFRLLFVRDKAKILSKGEIDEGGNSNPVHPRL